MEISPFPTIPGVSESGSLLDEVFARFCETGCCFDGSGASPFVTLAQVLGEREFLTFLPRATKSGDTFGFLVRPYLLARVVEDDFSRVFAPLISGAVGWAVSKSITLI